VQNRITYEILSFLGKIEKKKLIRKYYSKEPKYQPIFIIGVPRTGSTFLYQLLVENARVLYINNYMAKKFQIIFSASKKYNKKEISFLSNFGKTFKPHEPSEAGYFWNQWFSNEFHYSVKEDLNKRAKKEIYSTITALINYHNKPILFKNLAIGQRLQVIKEIFPQAIFINIKRDPLYVCQSILKARISLYSDKNYWFSIKPKEYDLIKDLDYKDQIPKQLFFLEKQIEEDLKLFDDQNSLTLEYENLVSNLDFEIKKIKSFLLLNKIDPQLSEKLNYQISSNSNSIKIDESDFKSFKEKLKTIKNE